MTTEIRKNEKILYSDVLISKVRYLKKSLTYKYQTHQTNDPSSMKTYHILKEKRNYTGSKRIAKTMT